METILDTYMAYVPSQSLDELLKRMEELLAPMIERGDELRHFHATYFRTTQAVKEEIDRGGFLDNEWVEVWDVRFADLYLEPLERWTQREEVAAPWRVAFEATRGPHIPPLRHILLGINAHVNYDLPQALLAVISDDEFQQEAVLERRHADHKHIDDVLIRRVAAENRARIASSQPGEMTVVDRLLIPLNRLGTKKFLKEARSKVWHNARQLSVARRRGREELSRRLRELEELSAARVADLRAPGQVVLKLALRGFGVRLPDAGS